MEGLVEGEHHLPIYVKDTFNRRGQLWSSRGLINLGLCSFQPPTHHFQLQLLVQGGVEFLLLPAVHLHDLHNNPVLVVLQPPHHHCSTRGRACVLRRYFRYRRQQRRRERRRGVGGVLGGFLAALAACLHGNCLGLAFPLGGRGSSSTLGFGLLGASRDGRRRMKI